MAKNSNKAKFKHQANSKPLFNHSADTGAKILMHDHKHPVFCFKHLHKDKGIQNCTNDEQRLFLNQLVNLSKLTWDEIERSPRHGMGSEKIDRNSLKIPCPAFITDDVTYLLALRFQAKKPFLIHRDRFICHVIFIDNNFDVYNHS